MVRAKEAKVQTFSVASQNKTHQEEILKEKLLETEFSELRDKCGGK